MTLVAIALALVLHSDPGSTEISRAAKVCSAQSGTLTSKDVFQALGEPAEDRRKEAGCVEKYGGPCRIWVYELRVDRRDAYRVLILWFLKDAGDAQQLWVLDSCQRCRTSETAGVSCKAFPFTGE